MILVIKHVEVEGPGTLEDYFIDNGYNLKFINLHEGDKPPNNFDDIEAIISLGGPMNVYEEEKYPFLKEEDAFIKEVVREDIPLLGICLGSQLLAKACGARVKKSPVKEVGWFKVELNKEGMKDPLFRGVEPALDVFHWHEDMFEIPRQGKLLATSKECPHQAFKVGQCAYGIQFHIEVTGKIISDWCDPYFKSPDLKKHEQAQEMVEMYHKKEKSFKKQSDAVYKNFVELFSKKTIRF